MLVVDLSEGYAGRLCVRLLGLMGAEVQCPGGAPDTYLDALRAPDASPPLTDETLRALEVRGPDVIVTSVNGLETAGLDRARLLAESAGSVLVVTSPFGLTGAWSRWEKYGPHRLGGERICRAHGSACWAAGHGARGLMLGRGRFHGCGWRRGRARQWSWLQSYRSLDNGRDAFHASAHVPTAWDTVALLAPRE